MRLALLLLALLTLPAPAAAAQEQDLLYGRVLLADGTIHEGYLRWGRSAAARGDLLTGVRALPPENAAQVRRLRAEADPEAARAARSVLYQGILITWEVDDADAAPDSAQSGVRFRHVREILRTGERTAAVRLVEGLTVELTAPAGAESFVSRVAVTSPAGEVSLGWGEVLRVELGPPPADASPPFVRLHGTVTDREGNRFTGDLTWGGEALYRSDGLPARGEPGGRVTFARLASAEPRGGGLRLELEGGRRVDVAGLSFPQLTIMDPALGSVRLQGRSVAGVSFHEPAAPGAERPGSGGRLAGTVLTSAGERLQGRIRWDDDEAYGWEMLNGQMGGLTLAVEFAAVAAIERLTPRSSRVTLRDGRDFELSGSNDVGSGHRGVVVELADGSFRFVDWLDFRELRLEP